jgi:replication factor A1
MVQINQIQLGQPNVDVTGTIKSVGEARTVTRRDGGTSKVADAILADESGEIKLSLWDSQIDSIKTGSKLTITNGFVSTFKGEKQLSIGKYGKFAVV